MMPIGQRMHLENTMNCAGIKTDINGLTGGYYSWFYDNKNKYQNSISCNKNNKTYHAIKIINISCNNE